MNNYTFSNQKRVANHGVLNFRLFSLFMLFVSGLRIAKPTGFSRKKTFAHITFILSFFLLVNESAMGQTTFSWRNDQNPTSGQWNVASYWWNGSAGALPGGGEILFLDGSVGATMTNDLPSTNRYRINFGSSGASSRTIGGSTTNAFYDFGGNIPAIVNSSGVLHTINFPFQIGNTSTSTSPQYGMEINASSGNLTFGSTIFAQNATGTKVLVLRASSSGTGTITLNGAISNGSGTMSIRKDESNVAILGAANTYTGSTSITGGTLRLSGSGTLGTGSDVTISSGATLDLNGVNATVGSISETGSSNGGVVTLGAGTLTINGANKATKFQNSISGTGGLTMAGSGTTELVLYGTQSYTGTTTVSGGKLSSSVAYSSTNYSITGGTLQLNAANIIPDASTMTLGGGTFSTGSSAGFGETLGTLTLSANSTINLGTGVHTLTFANSSASSWTATANLVITGWTGTPLGTSNGTAGKIFIGNSSSGLTASQLARIYFSVGGSHYTATQLSTGEVVPTANIAMFWGATTTNNWVATTGTRWDVSPTATTYATNWTNGRAAIFNVASSAITIATTQPQVASITANENVTVTYTNNTFSTGATQMPLYVASGKLFNFAATSFATAAGTGIIKNGPGTLQSGISSAYPGGFILNEGMVAAAGVNAMGAGGSLTINGGTIAGTGNRTFTGKFTGGITIGGNFTLGSSTSPASAIATLLFDNATALGSSATRTITLGGTGTMTWNGVISGTSSNLVVNCTSAGGIFIMGAANTYTGSTTIGSAATVQLGVANAIPVGNPGGGLILNGGTLSTGATTGFSNGTSSTNNMGTLTMQTSSTIALGTGNHSLYFSAASFTAGQTLTISGWTGSPGVSGTAGKIFIGSSASLTSDQLAQITINSLAVTQLSTGEIVPLATMYRSAQTGNWSATSTWERSINNGSTWIAAIATPTSSDGVITIISGHTVTVTASVTADQLVVDAGGQITINGVTVTRLTIADGVGTDMSVSGYVKVTTSELALSGTGSPTIVFNSGSTYEHNRTFVSYFIPAATWNTDSTCILTGTSSAPNTDIIQTFNNLIVAWTDNTPRYFNTNVPTVNGTFKIESGVVGLTNTSGTNSTVNVKNFLMTGGGLTLNNNTSNLTAGRITASGNVTLQGGTLQFSTGSVGTGWISCQGNLTIESGLTLSGNLPSTSGFLFNGTGASTVFINKALTTSGSSTGSRFWTLTTNGPSSVSESYGDIVAQNTINGTTTPPAGYSAWPTSGSLLSNVTINNAAGVTLSTAKVINTTLFRTNGSLGGTPNVTYASGATLHYNGTGAITTADEEFPSSNGPTNFVVSNPVGVTLHANRTLTGNLTVNNSGVLNLGANTINRGSAGGTLTLGDNTTLRIGGTGTFPTNYSTHSIAATSTVNYNGANQEVALISSSQSYGNLTLSGSGTKTFAHATDTNIGGNFTVEGVTVTAPTRLNFNGTTAQSIAGLAYNNIEFSGTGNKTFTSNASVSPTSEITFTGTPGTVDFDGASNNLEFVLQSTVNGTARVGNTTGWTLNGQLRAERFVPAKRAWRLLTAPLKGNANNSIYANWQGTTNEGLLLWHPQGGGDTGLAVGPQSNIWSYSGTGWASVTNTNTANLYDGSTNNAYLIFATGSFGSQNISSGADATTIRAKGALITGDKDYSLIANQFKLIGNPYASPINTEVMVSDLANSGSKIWLLDPTNGLGAYVTYDGTNWSVPTPSGNDKYIQSGQAFFIRRNSNTFTVKESHKVAGNSNTWFERNANNETNLENSDRIRVLLYKQDTNNWLFADGALAVNSSNGNNNVDDTDATKISNFNESLFLRNSTTNLSIEYRALPQLGDIQALRLTGTTNGSYQLRLYTENYTNSTIQPYLEDTQTTSIYEIPTDGSEIIVPFEGVVSNSSNPITRFRLVYQSTLDTQDPTKIGVSIYPNPVDEGYLTISLDNNLSATTYALTNLLGQEVQRGNLMLLENVINVNKLPKGVYFITIKQNEKNYSKKIIFN